MNPKPGEWVSPTSKSMSKIPFVVHSITHDGQVLMFGDSIRRVPLNHLVRCDGIYQWEIRDLTAEHPVKESNSIRR